MAQVQAVYDNAPSQQGYFIGGTVLSRVLAEAPYYPRVSDNKTAALVRPRNFAIRFPFMQLNRPGIVSWLVFDLDHRWVNRWEDVGLPPPNMIVRDRVKNTSQLSYAIHPVCTTTAGRGGPIAYMKAIYDAFVARLGADTSYRNGGMAKTPGHPWWLTTELHTHVYDLGELAQHVELERAPPWAKKINLEDVARSRHCLLFEHLRHYAYSIVNRERESGSFDRFHRLLEAYAHNKNTFIQQGFSSDLPLSSLRSTVKSVARWTWDVYTGLGRCHRGAMKLDPDLPLPIKQRMSAERTHEVRRKATESKIRAACATLRARGEAVTLSSVAKLAHIARQTIAGYKHAMTTKAAGTVVPINPLPPVNRGVKYGAYQVAAVLFSLGKIKHSAALVCAKVAWNQLLNQRMRPRFGDSGVADDG